MQKLLKLFGSSMTPEQLYFAISTKHNQAQADLYW